MKNYYVRYIAVAFAMVLIVLGSTRVLALAGRPGGLSNFFGSNAVVHSSDSATEPTGTAEPSETAEPTETAEPSETAEPTEVDDDQDGDNDENEGEIVGTVEGISDTSWVVSGQTFGVTPDTEIDDGIVTGDTVKVEFVTNADGSLTATEIESENEDDQGEDLNDDNSGEDDDTVGEDNSGEDSQTDDHSGSDDGDHSGGDDSGSGGDDDSGHGGGDD